MVTALKKRFLIILQLGMAGGVLWNGVAVGQEVSPLKWFEQHVNNSSPGVATSAVIHRLLFIQDWSDKEGVQYLAVDKAEFEKDTMLELVEPWESSFSDLVNRGPVSLLEEKVQKFDNAQQFFGHLLRTTYADTIIYAPPKKKKWQVYRADPGEGVRLVFELPAPTSKIGSVAADLKKWLVENLGYGGVVFDRKGQQILVGSYKQIAASDNALLTWATQDKFILQKSASQGAALLKLVKCEESFCIFDILLEKEKETPMGAKVIF